MNKNVLLMSLALASLTACQGSSTSGGGGSGMMSLSSGSVSGLSLKLTDAPNENLTSVFVNIDRLELFLEKGGNKGRLILPHTGGPVDLLQLQNGITMDLANVEIPADITLRQIRFVLKESGHSAVKQGGEVCDLKTPSAQTSGLKLKFTKPLTFQAGSVYALTFDFDAKKSVNQLGNGDCLLKPVLFLKAADRVVVDDPPSDNGGDDNSGSGDTGGDNSGGGTAAGSDPVDVGTGETDGGFTDEDGNGLPDWEYPPLPPGSLNL